MGPYILREATGEWHTNGVTRESSEVLVSHENERPYLQAKIQSIQVPFFRKSYACYSHMEIPLTTTIKIIIIVIIIRRNSLAESPPRDLQITAYMVCSCTMPSNCV